MSACDKCQGCLGNTVLDSRAMSSPSALRAGARPGNDIFIALVSNSQRDKKTSFFVPGGSNYTGGKDYI